MSDSVKKVFKKLDPFTAKVVDPILGDMGLPNISGRNAAREQAAEQARRAEQQAQKAADLAKEQARGEQLNMQTAQERDRLLAEAEDARDQPVGEPDVQAREGTESVTERRKRYQASSVGGTGQAGPSVRI